ncbi:DUF4326 domain-containing protein [Laspinema olomoucense]|uniref:DUF4326 domain-containing protein n=1 Tax=Laspinema olomoucense TaxID=3231600 RepID=UPI0021BA40DD|nr:DUF4326 domain-containing protein [Laspinema sp. D3a]MCT7991913.1 DUF4326 domain-containing protein [Laspinema sp. D3a]
MLELVNLKSHGWLGTHYIGRSNPKMGLLGSALANPFRIGVHGNRQAVVQAYRRWLWQQVKAGLFDGVETAAFLKLMALARQHKAGHQLNLSCYCAPLLCHGYVIIRCIQWLIDGGYIP